MKTKMMAAVFGVFSMLTAGAAVAADEAPQTPYYENVQSDNALVTPPNSETDKMTPMEGKPAYGESSDGDMRYAEEILTGENENHLNKVTDPSATDQTLPKGAGHKAYDKATEPN